jgi:hypothetical protein
MNWRNTRARAERERERRASNSGKKKGSNRLGGRGRGRLSCGMGKWCVLSVEMLGQNGGLGNWMGLVRNGKESTLCCNCKETKKKIKTDRKVRFSKLEEINHLGLLGGLGFLASRSRFLEFYSAIYLFTYYIYIYIFFFFL